MFTAEIHVDNTISTLTCPTVEALYCILFTVNCDAFVHGVQVKARNGQHPDYPDTYFAGYTRDGLAALFNN